MTRGTVRRLGAAGLVFGCLIALPGQASADEVAPTLAISDASVVEGTGGAPTAIVFTVTRSGDLSAASTVTAATPPGPSADYAPKSQVLSFAVDDASEAFSVDVVADDLDEPNETFAVTLSAPTNATLGDATGTGTIVDDDATPTLAISGPATVAENGTAGYSVAISGKSAATVTVNWATVNGTTANADYGPPRSGSLSWASEDPNPKSISIPMVNDTLDEIDETFSVSLSSPSGATITTASAATAITDNDDEPTISAISDVTVVEGNTGTVDASITVTLSTASGKTVTVPYSTAPGTATEGGDFEAKTGNVVFVPGEDLTETIILKVKGDTLFEQDEKFSVVITDPINGGLGPDNRGEITITDDDSTPIPTLSSPSVLEGNPGGTTNLVFVATLNAPHPALSFNFRTVADTAGAADFDALTGSKSFPANSGTTATTVPITIAVKVELLDELDETMKLELLNNNDVVVRSATGTIRNDDNNSKLSISDASSDEPGTMKFTVTLAPVSGREVKVNWATADGTGTAGVDYTTGSGQLTFAPGEATKTIDVAVLGDEATEENETLKVNLSNPTGVPANNVVDAQGDGTIVDKNAPPSLSITDAIAREGQGATFTVTLAGSTLRTVTVGFNTIEATAKAGTDFSARTGTLTFEPGETSKTIVVTVLDDTDAEPAEDFFVGIGDAVNATITKNRGLGAIEASDQATVVEQPNPLPTPTTKPPAARLVPRMILGPRTVSIGANGVAKMLVTCQKVSPIGCSGSVELERAARPLLKLGKKTFTVKKGTKGYASVKLSLKSLKLLQKNGTMRVKVIVIVKTSTKSMKVSPGTITLKATRALMKAKLKAPAPTPKVVVDP